MTTTQYKCVTISLAAGFILLFVLSASLLWRHARREIEIAFATEQTAILEEMRSRALQLDQEEAAGLLLYAVRYYPSGTKQRTGSPLDKIVERERAGAIRDIIAHLRTKTGQDFGEDPQKWIDRFAKR